MAVRVRAALDDQLENTLFNTRTPAKHGVSKMNYPSGGLADAPIHDSAPTLESLINLEGEEPIRAEILGPEGLQRLAGQLAHLCQVAKPRFARSPLLRRFADNKRVLISTISRLGSLGGRQVFSASEAEWLIDNSHIITDALREVQCDFPAGYDAELPKLAVPPLDGYPRVYALALCLVAHSDSAMDETQIANFVAAFQETVPLTIGELWALPTVLRIALLENLRRLGQQILRGWEERQRREVGK